MKKGTIIRNHWASNRNPYCCFIYIGKSGKYVDVLCYDKGRLLKQQFYASDFKDNPEVFEVIGESNGFDILKNDLKEALKDQGEKDEK